MRSTSCVILGVLWAKYKESIESTVFEKRKYPYFLIITLLLFFAFDFAKTNNIPINTGLLTTSLVGIFFDVSVVLLIYKISITNIVTMFLGKISLEIYVTQHLFLSFFKKNWFNGVFPGVNVENTWLYCLLVVACTFAFSAIIEPFIRRFFGMKIWQSKKEPKGN